MASFIGGGGAKQGNFVPQPVPSYTPDGYHRCEACNRLMKDGRECYCKTREKPKAPGKVMVGKYDWHEFRDYGKPGKRYDRNGKDFSRDDDLGMVGAGGRRPGNGRPACGADHQGADGQEELKPCPFCGQKHLTMAKAYGKYKVKCTACATVYGPAREAPELARMAWNRRRA